MSQLPERIAQAVQPDGGLDDGTDPYGGICASNYTVLWLPKYREVALHGQFTPDELEAIAAHMRKYSTKTAEEGRAELEAQVQQFLALSPEEREEFIVMVEDVGVCLVCGRDAKYNDGICSCGRCATSGFRR